MIIDLTYAGHRQQYLVTINGGWNNSANTYRYFKNREDALSFFNDCCRIYNVKGTIYA